MAFIGNKSFLFVKKYVPRRCHLTYIVVHAHKALMLLEGDHIPGLGLDP